VDQHQHDGGAPAIGAAPTSCQALFRAARFGRVVAHADAAILREACEDVDALEHVIHSFDHFAVMRALGLLPVDPLMRSLTEWCDIFAALATRWARDKPLIDRSDMKTV
jgi:hypothetical protein